MGSGEEIRGIVVLFPAGARDCCAVQSGQTGFGTLSAYPTGAAESIPAIKSAAA